MKAKKEVRFGDLKVGDRFFQKLDECDCGGVVLEKIEPTELSGVWHNAKVHKVYVGPIYVGSWADDEIVLAEA